MPAVKFLKISSDQEVVSTISGLLNEQLEANKKTLWIVAGGSFIPIAVKIRNALIKTDLLSVTMSDERYGPVGHADSNWQQLLNAGFNTKNINYYEILKGDNISETTNNFENFLENIFKTNGSHIGTLGMGADGHTAGILPNSELFSSQKLASHYTALDFERITITPKCISALGMAFVYAVGSNKHQAIENFSKTLEIEQQPVQIIKLVENAVFINDYKGETL